MKLIPGFWGVMVLGFCLSRAEDINPFPREILRIEKIAEWTFADGVAGWSATHDCSIKSENGVLAILSTGNDPYLASPPFAAEGPVVVKLRARCAGSGSGQIFWMTSEAPFPDESRSEHFTLVHDGQWHEYEVRLPSQGRVTRLRLDPGTGPGSVQLEKVQLARFSFHPLEIQKASSHGHVVEVTLTNHSAETITCRLGNSTFAMAGASAQTLTVPLPGKNPFESYNVEILPQGLPALHRRVFCADTNLSTKWISLGWGNLNVRVAADGSGARIELEGKLVGFLAPLATRENVVAKLTTTKRAGVIQLRGQGFQATVAVHSNEIAVRIQSDEPCEGPVLRALGPLEQGLFAGVEYLGKGESSSSTLDIETDEHIRFAPDPMKVTMPLMAFVTDRASTAMTWEEMTLQPVFATPNFLDGAEGHRAALRGKTIAATILVTKPRPMEEAILWAVRRRGLPPVPSSPRGEQAQFDFCLKTLSGPPLKTAAGWGHCAESQWTRQPFADQASTVWRLSGKAPELPHLVPGGSHIRNDAIYLVTSRAKDWIRIRTEQAQGLMAEQQADGSFRYHGKYQRGHFEDTASGYCAPKAAALLETARLLGNRSALAAGLKALDFMSHFHDPRGAQTWECPLHTPDILASAYLVEAYVLGYELTGKTEYLEHARAWAITGMPFVYQWSCRPIMAYATTPVFGATNWRAPNWIGLPVQWCGYDYAYALTKLAPLDQTLDWKRIATGILVAAEQMQYPEGEYAGCVPDSFNLSEQHRNGPAINPCAIVSLRLVLGGRLDALACAVWQGHRIVAPFPVTIQDGQARIQASEGAKYQAVVDGEQILDVTSKGVDLVKMSSTHASATEDRLPTSGK